ncbi:GTPase-activating protein RGS2 Ecym_5412 [Eremothecium cymbalariae DBVPG|uniref:RGS domain-containing protein n=1 Tax=Eremothecium cymbalariae (strain CBS 270.75 / DBVPG 7215 / KCTC 17166 / NRRL Y-17582) TaxID=931890 RepID=I6NDM4_ERECY|nr:hypothetical protein Ecym_5412 [Eremothecium cymbalariae DBVPG\
MGYKIPTLQELLDLQQQRQDNKNEPVTIQEQKLPLQATLVMFHDFLRKTHCDENLQFWLMTDPFVSQEQQQLGRAMGNWNRIYDTFIRQNSPKECNFPESIRTVFDDHYSLQSIPERQQIELARNHILNLLEDAYTRFHRHLLDSCNINNGKFKPFTHQKSVSAGSAVNSNSSSAYQSAPRYHRNSLSRPPLRISNSDADPRTTRRMSECAVSDDDDECYLSVYSESTRPSSSRRLSISTKQRQQHLSTSALSGLHNNAVSSLRASKSNPQTVAILEGNARNTSCSILMNTAATTACKLKTRKQIFSKFKFGRRSSSSSSTSSS